jgi:hypothetical protein
MLVFKVVIFFGWFAGSFMQANGVQFCYFTVAVSRMWADCWKSWVARQYDCDGGKEKLIIC